MKAFKKLSFVIISISLSLTLLSCSGGGGGGGNSSSTVITGHVVDGFIAGATVTAYQVNADGTQGAQIGTPVTTDQFGNYTLNLGTYSGPVYLTSQGGTYIDTATGNTIDLNNPPYSSMILSAIVSNASGDVTVQINPLTTMAANVALTLAGQGTPVASAADEANTLIQNYFGLTSSILNTDLVSLTTTSCMTGQTQQSADESAILAGISQLAFNNGVGTPDLIQALIQDVSSDGQFDGLASKTIISVPLTSGTGTLSLSQIEGPALTNLASAINQFMASTSNACAATVDSSVTSALSNTSIFPTPPPAAPTGVQATAGFGSATINWNPVTGATSYNVYMATSTGVTGTSTQLPGFRSIQNVTSPADISTGPTNTYYFVVTAATGTSPYEIESVPSAEVSAFVTSTALPALWAQTVSAGTGTSASDFNGVSVASDGSAVYAAGDIYGTGAYNFGPSVMSQGTCTSSNIVLVKYNSSGAAQWARTVTAGSDQSSFNSVASDGSAVYAAGYIYGTGNYNFGNGVTATGTYIGSNVVLVQYNSSTGVAQWARTLTAGSDQSSFSSVAEASDGSVYAAGNIHGTGTYNFGNGVIAGTSNGYNPVLVKYNSSGVAQWAQTVTAATNESSFNSVSVASDGSVYAAGYIAGTGTFNFGNNVISAGTYTNGGSVVLVKYDSSGLAQWAQTVTAGPGDSFFTSVSAVASDGSVYAAGYIQGTGPYTFGTGVPPITGTSTDGINMVLVKYNSAGVAQWAQTVTGGSGSSDLFGVSVGSDGSVYAAGFIDGTVAYNFGNSVTATGVYTGENVVLVKYDSFGVASWAQTVTAASNGSFFAGVSVASGGYVYAAGDISGTGTFNFGNGKTAAGTYAGGNLVLVGY
jgi:hypothetical protein